MQEKLNDTNQSLISSISDIKSKKIELVLDRGIRWIIMILFVLINVLMMMDNGLLSSASSIIKKTLKVNDQLFGLFGSCNHSGRIIGTIIFMIIFNTFNRKYLLLLPLYINTLALFSFTITNIISILFIARVLNGLCTAFGFIYFPIWIDQFGIQTKKTMMMSLIQMAPPIGLVLGYFQNTILTSEKWKLSFLMQSIILFFLVTLLLFIPQIFFSQKISFQSRFEGVAKINEVEEINNSNTRKSKIKINNNNNKNNNKNKVISISRPSIYNLNEEIINDDTLTILKKLNFIFFNKIFITTVLYKSTNLFICTAIGFWLTNYIENIFGENRLYYKLYSYIIIVVIGPISGLILGGIIGSLIGGYEKKNSLLVILIFQILSSFFAFLIPMAKNLKIFILFFAIFNAFSSAVVPVNAGLILWSVPKNLKGFANGVSCLITTFLGKFPAPFLYGVLQQNFSYIDKKIGMIALMFFPLLGVLFLGLATFFRFKEKNLEIERTMEENNLIRKISFVESLRESMSIKNLAIIYNNNNGVVQDLSFSSEECSELLEENQLELELENVSTSKT